MKLTSRHIAAFFLLILLSVGFGFAFDGIATAIEKRNYPRPKAYRNAIAAAAEEAGIPEAAVLAVVRAESGFDGAGRDADGGTGLFRLTYERFSEICTDILHEPVPEAGMLYDPATNLRAGCAYLSFLYARYGMWEPVFAAWRAGTEKVDAWILDPACLNKQGKLTNIPDPAAAKFTTGAAAALKMYTKLYYQ